MSIMALLQDLRQSGISVSAQGENLKVNTPQGTMTAELKQRLVQHKAALLRWLQESQIAEELALPVCTPDPLARYQPFPLSDMQFGFYMGDDPYMEFHVRPHYYIEKNPADFDLARYQAAWDKALQRHRGEIVVVRADSQLQVVENPVPLVCKVQDLGNADPQAVEQSLLAVRNEMMRSQLPLDTWPWLDLRVTQWQADGVAHSRIHYNHNNFFSDGFGTTRLLLEIDAYYSDPGLTLPPLSLSFRDAALTLDELAQSPAGKAAQRYWEQRLPSLPGPPALPIHANMERRVRSRLQRREGFIERESWALFKQHAASLGVTPSNAVFCAYAEVMGAWGNTRHFILSNMMTRRLNTHPEIKDIIGNFASLYPLEIDFRESNSFVDRARNIQERVILDAKHLHWGGMQVMQALNRHKGSLGTAAVPFVIGSGLFMEGFTRSDFSCLETSQVMLDHQFWEMPDGSYYYVWDLLEQFFPAGLIDSMWAAHQDLIRRLAHDPALWHGKVLDLTPAHMLAARAAVCPPATPAPDTLLHAGLADTLAATPAATALIAAGDGKDACLSYAELDSAATILARALLDAGARQAGNGVHSVALDDVNLTGKTVAIVAHRGVALFQAVFGVLKAGAAYVPIDPALPEERRNYILDNCQAVAVLTESAWANGLPWPAGIAVLAIEECVQAGQNDGPSNAAPFAPTHKTGPNDLAYLIYTSGSTGRPKGVMIEHGPALNTVQDVNSRFGVSARDRIFGVSSFGFDLSVYDLFGTVAAGATLIYPDPQQSLNPSHWLDLMLQHQATIWNSAPPLASLLIEAAENRGVTLPALRLVMMSGDWIAVDLPDRIRRIAPAATVISMGGATEASIWSIIYPIESVDPGWPSIPYGYPMLNQPWHILDDWGRPVPDWTAGDLYIGGIGLARGYWQDPEKTASSFIAHPQTGERIYRTGDIGRYLPGAVIEFLGRKDSQVKVSGHRIELGEIETVLTAADNIHAAVACVQTSATGNAQLVAFVVPMAGVAASDVDLEALRDLLAQKLPEYMVPRVLQTLERLPLSSNGKVDRKALPHVESHTVHHSTHERREPRNDTERRLLAIWRSILREPELSVMDDFFAMGGQSFEAVRIIGAVREQFGLSLSLGLIWQHRTVAQVAAQMDGEMEHGTQPHKPQLMLTLRAQGAGQTLYLVHPAGGHVMCYRSLTQYLDRPVHAFVAPGVEGHGEVLDSIEALAQTYVELLIAQQPQGPVLLGGWSSGALISFEMARQLRQRHGREVNGVVLIDCPAPHPGPAVDEAVLLAWFLEDLALDLPVAQLVAELTATITMASSTPLQRLQQISASLHKMGRELPIDLQQLSAIYQVFLGIVRGAKLYQGKPVDTDLLLLRAAEGVVSEFADHPHGARADWGWSDFTSRTIQASRHAASHYTLLNEPVLASLASAIEAWLQGRAAPSATTLSTPSATPGNTISKQ